MWEDATPKLPQTEEKAAGPRSARPPRSGNDLVLWAQLFLCGVILLGVLAARALQLPLFAGLRVAYTAALAEQNDLLPPERQFSRFAQQTLAGLGEAAKEVLDELREPSAQAAQGTAARRSHGKNVPAGCRLQSYTPAFALTAPLDAVTYATSGYGWRTNPVRGSGDEFHTGADLHADEGTPVHAAAAGVVRYAGSGVTYGNYVRILHEGGDETLYAHMQYLFVRTGQSVAEGEILGTSGQTGNVTGPHLHFELLHGGLRYDPTPLLQAVLE